MVFSVSDSFDPIRRCFHLLRQVDVFFLHHSVGSADEPQSEYLKTNLVRRGRKCFRTCRKRCKTLGPRKITSCRHQILRLPRKMTPVIDLHYISQVISNAHSHRTHPPTYQIPRHRCHACIVIYNARSNRNHAPTTSTGVIVCRAFAT